MAEARKSKRRSPTTAMSVLIRGKHYPTIADAAEKLNVDTSSIYHALRDGTIDSVGIGSGRWSREGRIGNRAKPFSIAGITFPSRSIASTRLGFSPRYLDQALRNGKERARAKIFAAAMQLHARAENQALKEAAHG